MVNPVSRADALGCRRGFSGFFCSSICLCLILACNSKPARQTVENVSLEPTYGDTFIEGSIGDASVLIPLLASDSASHAITGQVYNGLVKYDKDINIVGDLAESWDISPDGLTITFHLRKGVKFHDGVECTAEDVLFTYQTLINPEVPTPYSSDFEIVKEARALDKYTFQVTYERPFAPALISWGTGILPKHLLEGRDITKSSLTRHPIGTGPYRFGEWKTGEKIVLTNNPDYFEGRPYLDRYIYRIIPDQSTMFLELQAGGIDMMGLTPFQFHRKTDAPDFKRQYNKYRYLSFSFTYLGYNLLDPKFSDKRVRQAISYALNKEEIVDGVLMGLGVVANGPYKPGSWYYNPKVKPYPYDPNKARDMLAQSGWRDTDGDGVLDKKGQPFQFTIVTNQGNEQRAKVAEIAQFRLKEIGIQVKIKIVEWAAFLKEFVDKKKFEAIILGWSGFIDPDMYAVFHSSQMGEKQYNFISYNNPEVDKLLEEGRYTFDQEARRKAYFRIQEILAEDQPYTFLYVPEATPVVSSRVYGIEPAPLGISYNFIRWYVPQSLQRHTKPSISP